MQQKAGEEPGNEATLTPWTADHIAVALVAAPREVVVDWDDSWYAIVKLVAGFLHVENSAIIMGFLYLTGFVHENMSACNILQQFTCLLE